MSDTDTPSAKREARLPAVASPPATPSADAAASAGNTPPATPAVPAVTAVVTAPSPTQRLCLDCGALLEGKYCVACGQRAQLRNLSLPSLAHDAIKDFTDVDSRAWITLRALLLRPGFLTREFLQGRRTRYLPPFRLYLVLSLIFFLLLSANPAEEAVVIGGTEANSTPVVTGADPEALKQVMEDLNKELEQSGATKEQREEAAKAAAAATKAIENPNALIVDTDTDCSKSTWGLNGREWYSPQLAAMCEKLKKTSRREFGRKLFGNVPKAMFISLPLLALVNFVLYAFSRRKYVEHLLFYVHFHAFAFLLLTLNLLVGLVFGWVGLGFIAGMVTFAAIIYLFVALYKSMRTVYGQSGLMTTFKYIVVIMAYGFFSVLTLIATMAYTAWTV